MGGQPLRSDSPSKIPLFYPFIFQDSPFCAPSPKDQKCLGSLYNETLGCLDDCTGIHAGISRVDDKLQSAYEEEKKSTTNDFQKMVEILSIGDENIK